MNVHVLYVLEDKTSTKKIPSVCLSVCPSVRGLSMWTQELSKELADPNKIWWVGKITILILILILNRILILTKTLRSDTKFHGYL